MPSYMNQPIKLLVVQKKGYSFRLLDLATEKTYRAISSRFSDLAVGGLLLVDQIEIVGDLIESMNVLLTVRGDSKKKKTSTVFGKYALGDLIDGVPILRFGSPYYSNGKKLIYAYFSCN